MSAKFLAVKGFATFQHYRDRNPPWIKLYGTLLSDAAFLQMPEAAQAQLVKLWILASQLGHPLPNNPKLLAGKIGTVGRFHLPNLIDAGFLIPCNDPASEPDSDPRDESGESASNALAEREHIASNGASRLLAKSVSRARARRADARTRESTEIELENRTTKKTTTTTSPTREKPRAAGRETWLTPICTAWEAKNGAGTFAGIAGRTAKAIAPLRTAGHDLAEIGERLGVYLDRTESRFWSVERFAATYGQWEQKPSVDPVTGCLTQEAHDRLMRA